MPGTNERKGGSKDDPYHVVRLPEREDPFEFAKVANMRVVWVSPMFDGGWELTCQNLEAIKK